MEQVWGQSTGYLRRAIALPIMVNMSGEQIEKVISSVKEVAAEIL
jgi:dTDP-4-amino-4,6-dideoxygalactose transaminase